MRRVSVPPRRSKVRSCKTRSSLPCAPGESAATSSRTILPLPRRSTAIAPRSLPRTAALWPVGNSFAGKVFVPERAWQVLFGRRTFRQVGEFELWGHAPEALEIVVAPRLLAKNVHDEAAEIQ